jgi:TonB-dependent receptor
MFTKNRLRSSIAALAVLGSIPAFAQDTQESQDDSLQSLEEVVVRGVRSSVISAQNIKMNAQQITDSIVAEDIGKLPDNSVAEALQRVTGVQITRMNGEASGVMVRGLPDVVTTLNGRNIFTTNGRSISLADIPADLLQRVDVKKSVSADDLAGGIAGVIDVRLRRPFDFDDGLTMAGGVRAVHSAQAESTDPVGSVTVNNNWDTNAGRFGAMLSMSYQDRGFMDQVNFNTAPALTTVAGVRPADAPDSLPAMADGYTPGMETLMPGVIGQYFRYGDRNRTSFNGAFQWSPNDNAEYYAEVFQVSYEQDSQLNFWVPLPFIDANRGYVSEFKGDTNVVKEFVNADSGFPLQITSNQSFANSSDTLQVAFGGEWNRGNLTIESDFAYTESEAENRGFILDLGFFVPTVIYDFSRNNSGASDVTLRNADGSAYDLFNEANYELWQYFDSYSRQKSKELAWSADFNYAFDDGAITSVDFGTRLAQRKTYNQSADPGGRGNISGGRIGLDQFPGMADTTPDDFLSDVVDLSTSQWLTPSASYIMENRASIREAMGYAPTDPYFRDELLFDNQEDNYAVYAKANYELEVAGMVLDGQVGARVVKLDSIIRGNSVEVTDAGETVTPVDLDYTDTEFLPSASARLQITDDLHARAAISTSVTRPGFNALNPATAVFQPNETVAATGSGGNPNLESTKSTNYDLSLEWYFAPASSVSGAYFYRDLNGRIETFGRIEQYNGQDFFVTRPGNTGDGYLEGVELAYTQFFDMLPSFWSGLGVQANITLMDGEQETPPDLEGNTEMMPISSVSDKSYNLVLLYEYEKVSARLAYNWRSDFVASFSQDGAQPGNELNVKDSDSLDAAFNYDINDNFTVSVEATNLTDSVYGDYFGGDSAADAYLYPRDTYARERTYSVGARFRF